MPLAASMAEEILGEFEDQIESWELVPGRELAEKKGYGMYEISIDGELVYSKKVTGAHITSDQFRGLIRERLEG